MQTKTPGTYCATKRKRTTHLWFPSIGEPVEAFWTGEGEQVHGNLRGEWYKGKVVDMTWPEEKGIPGMVIKYEDGTEEWHGVDEGGETVRTTKARKKAYGKRYTTIFPERVTEWMGIGTRLKINWRGGDGKEALF
jgi:hypothetical protein